MNYVHFKRIGIQQVSVEFMLMELGYNLRKFIHYSNTKIKFKILKLPKEVQ